ncbi:MAG: hypothetical protein SWO11_01860 [Thermodesulfobacteriota bacterium]|nr:hypothetical protein [Thermodesulfobacteriota bacterium]
MLYRYKIRPMSPVMTPFMSDTFFGHFCWAVLYEKGAVYLDDFLSIFGAGHKAPVLFSSAFVSGYLPKPVLPPPKRDEIREFVKSYFVEKPYAGIRSMSDKGKRFDGMTKIKTWNNLKLISIEDWLSLKDDYCETHLLEIFYKRLQADVDSEKPIFETEIAASTTISRLSGTVPEEGGGLFQREKTWYHKDMELDLYVEINQEEIVPLVKWFLCDYLPLYGFGKDKSVGMRCIEVEQDNLFSQEQFSVNNPNSSVTLSLAAFDGMAKYKSFYRLMTKFGKLGGNYAYSSPTGGGTKPYKKPILMIEPGGVFFTNEDLSAKPLLDEVHSDPSIRQCGIPVMLPLRIREDRLDGTA